MSYYLLPVKGKMPPNFYGMVRVQITESQNVQDLPGHCILATGLLSMWGPGNSTMLKTTIRTHTPKWLPIHSVLFTAISQTVALHLSC